MISILSPAKSLDPKKDEQLCTDEYSKPRFFSDSVKLIEILREKNLPELMQLMDISEKLALENRDRYAAFRLRQNRQNAHRAAAYFNGGVYQGLKFQEWDDHTIRYGQNHLRILSGLYGLLRPLDLIQPYRLEMGTALENPEGKNLYHFWSHRISDRLKADFRGHQNKVLINLASKEYSKVITEPPFPYPIIDIDFREQRGDRLQFISYTAKTARGLLARYIMSHEIDSVEALKSFDWEGYRFQEQGSTESRLLFVRS